MLGDGRNESVSARGRDRTERIALTGSDLSGAAQAIEVAANTRASAVSVGSMNFAEFEQLPEAPGKKELLDGELMNYFVGAPLLSYQPAQNGVSMTLVRDRYTSGLIGVTVELSTLFPQ